MSGHGRPTCGRTGKVAYPSRRAARAALGRVQHRGRAENGVYPCPWCASFHLTHKANRRRAAA